MKQAILDKKIDGFLRRKSEQFPELSRSVAAITRELEAEEDAVHAPLHELRYATYLK